MATSDPVPGPDNLFGVSNNLQSRVNLFREMIEEKKSEVRKVSKEMKSLIETKEKHIIQGLDTILENVLNKIERKSKEVQTKIKEIEKKKDEIEIIFRELGKTETSFQGISESIDSIKRKMDIDIPRVKLTWKLNELKDCINRMCCCEEEQVKIYDENTRFKLKWSNCDRGSEDNQLYYPWGIATNPNNDNIYVANSSNHRVQIFSNEGKLIRSVKNEKMKSPLDILFHSDSIYVQCSSAILKLNKFTEKTENFKSYIHDIRGICTDNTFIYVGKLNGMTLIALNQDLNEENMISIETEFCGQETLIWDISFSQDSFYILFYHPVFPIQAFSKEGILIRCVVKKDNINNAYCFCLDPQLNILVADYGDSKVKIFSNEGKLITQFGEKGTEEGQFTNSHGISLDEFGSVITVDRKTSNMLQLFV